MDGSVFVMVLFTISSEEWDRALLFWTCLTLTTPSTRTEPSYASRSWNSPESPQCVSGRDSTFKCTIIFQFNINLSLFKNTRTNHFLMSERLTLFYCHTACPYFLDWFPFMTLSLDTQKSTTITFRCLFSLSWWAANYFLSHFGLYLCSPFAVDKTGGYWNRVHDEV